MGRGFLRKRLQYDVESFEFSAYKTTDANGQGLVARLLY